MLCGGVKVEFPPDTGKLLGSVDIYGRCEVEMLDSKQSMFAEKVIEGLLLVASNI